MDEIAVTVVNFMLHRRTKAGDRFYDILASIGLGQSMESICAEYNATPDEVNRVLAQSGAKWPEHPNAPTVEPDEVDA